jgi:hypothetical protein
MPEDNASYADLAYAVASTAEFTAPLANAYFHIRHHES